jgi:hypothetical protein
VNRNAPVNTFERGAKDAAALHALDREFRFLAELHRAALGELQLHARIVAGAQAVLGLQHRARRERNGIAPALEPRGVLHRLDHRRGLRLQCRGKESRREGEIELCFCHSLSPEIVALQRSLRLRPPLGCATPKVRQTSRQIKDLA